ncbi:hypothetical protein GY45DRAFT_840146 [Cubamyces sp. BRFM 1775]|nr:hypothetical protein GY45DRAFT_840146 [Cubamyces sp. BRFM 1775]
MLTVARAVAFALLALSLFSLAEASVAGRRAATNAERLARGLAPARPRRLYMGSRTNAPRAAPSGAPGSTQVGILALYSTGSSPTSGATPVEWMGYGSPTVFIQVAGTFQYTQPNPVGSVVELECTTQPGFRLGGLMPAAHENIQLAAGSGNSVKLSSVSVHTDAGASNGVLNSGQYQVGFAETTIFSIDDTGRVTVAWVNPDGTTSQTYLILYAASLYATGDVARFVTAMGTSVSSIQVVDMYFVESGSVASTVVY